MKIKILYEDNHLLVVEKPINIPVQSDSSQDEDLLSLLKNEIKEKYNKPGNVYLGLVHRLDRPVGGVMVFAKTSKAASRLSDQVRKNELKKTYLAVVENPFLESTGAYNDYLYKDSKTNTSKVVSKDHKDAKFASLDYQVLDTRENLSLIDVHLHTGRSHQIRVQFASHAHPLWGDARYNPRSNSTQQIALWASQLTLTHPTTKEEMTFTSEVPKRYPYTLFELVQEKQI